MHVGRRSRDLTLATSSEPHAFLCASIRRVSAR